jgi:L-alanine-DL-glutamate epimerase-like enolase superfamily enzyme
MSATAVSSLPSTISQMECVPLDLPLTEPFAIAGGAPSVAHNVLIRIVLADGTVGLGEAAPFTAVSGETQASTLLALREVRARLVGQDVRGLRRLAGLLAEICPDEPAARAGCELALLDAFLRQHRMPMWGYFGGQATHLVSDLTITAGDIAHAVASAQAAVRRGFTTLKIKVGALSPVEDAERLIALYRGLPGSRTTPRSTELSLVLDANGGYSAEAALDLLRRLAAADVPVALFEQPVSRQDRLGLLDVARQTSVPICADESARSAADVLWLIQTRLVRAINLKLMKSGLFESLAMYELARAGGLALMMGGMVEGPLAMAAAAQIAAGLGGFSYIDLDTALFVASHPFRSEAVQDNADWQLKAVSSGHGVTIVEGVGERRGATWRE